MTKGLDFLEKSSIIIVMS